MSKIIQHMEQVVLPAIRLYWNAEAELSKALDARLDEARLDAMRWARHAAIELHHLSDVASNSREVGVSQPTLNAQRDWLAGHCDYHRGGEPCEDVVLLRDVADAFKHHQLDRPSATIIGADAVITCGTGFGRMRFGEGKFGGVVQVVITDKQERERALTSVIQNVVDAWRRGVGLPMADFGAF